MTITKTKENENLLIELAGRLDTSTAPELEAEVKNEITDVKSLTFDFAKLDYISSAGLRVLLGAQKVMNKQGKMVIKNVNDVVMEIFDVTGFSDILTFE